jgi:cob(I)alamin adenosyltransferase
LVRIYTKTGDDGTTGLFYGGRARKDEPRPQAVGSVDELQAALGVTRAHLGSNHPLAELCIEVERDLYVLMAELATLPENRSKLTPGQTLVTPHMVERLEGQIDHYSALFETPRDFVLPGETIGAAFLDVARTAARRAERYCVSIAEPDSYVLRYLNRLSDLLWVLARWHEGDSRLARD